jgi:hypothetical protein
MEVKFEPEHSRIFRLVAKSHFSCEPLNINILMSYITFSKVQEIYSHHLPCVIVKTRVYHPFVLPLAGHCRAPQLTEGASSFQYSQRQQETRDQMASATLTQLSTQLSLNENSEMQSTTDLYVTHEELSKYWRRFNFKTQFSYV